MYVSRYEFVSSVFMEGDLGQNSEMDRMETMLSDFYLAGVHCL